MSSYRFYKNELGWFIDLKWFPFDKANLAMVAGADLLLDQLSKGKDEVYLKISTKSFENYDDVLFKDMTLGLFRGALYSPMRHNIGNSLMYDNQLWLCFVTVFVFLRYPKTIYFKVI